MCVTFDDVKKEIKCSGPRVTIKTKQKNSIWKMNRPKKMDMLHF